RARVLVDLRCRLRDAAVRANSINDAAGATGNEEISLAIESNSVRARSAGRESLRQPRLRRIQVRAAHAHDCAERADGDKKIALRIEHYAGGIRVDFLAAHFAGFDATDNDWFGRLGIDAQNIPRHPVRHIEPTFFVRRYAFHDYAAVDAGGIEIDKDRRDGVACAHRRAAAKRQNEDHDPQHSHTDLLWRTTL